jgi:prepilin-type N-terminal cleavage/methylation domain-containing protein
MKSKINKGFSLVEVIFAATIFSVVAVSIYQGFIAITRLVSVSRDKVAAIDLINSEFELIRNLSYENVGLQTGIPNGVLVATTTVIKDGRQFRVSRTIRNIDDPFDGTIGGSPNDLSPADYKMVQLDIYCDSCKKPVNFSATANVSPKSLETASTNGALFVRVFDANGDPVPQANISISNSDLGISINETTDNNGLLQLVDMPPSENSYRIIADKSGFTRDRTYATSTSNPNPLKMDATVILQNLTQISFIIDRVSSIDLRTINNSCSPVADVPFEVNGTKLIGSAPDVFKWVGNFSTDSSGIKNISNIEWDTYSFTTSGGFYLVGTNPISPVSILPNSNQNIDLTVSNDDPAFLLVNVKDGSTSLPISDATVRLTDGAYFDQTKITNQGFINQTNWIGGGGQLNFIDETRYHSSDGNIEVASPEGEIKLASSLGVYVPSGEITSSIFDTGAPSNWSKVDILPTDQPVLAGANSVRFQIATSEDNTATTTWDFLGPDGTNATFYSITNNNINSVHDGDRYLRYKIFLSTADTSLTPNVSDFVVSFSSSCIPPGQAYFSDLSFGNYTVEVSASGYATQTINPVNIGSDWQKQDVFLLP